MKIELRFLAGAFFMPVRPGILLVTCLNEISALIIKLLLTFAPNTKNHLEMKHLILISFLFISTLSFTQFSLNRDTVTDPQKKKYSVGAFGSVFEYGLITGIEGGLHMPNHSFHAGLGVNTFSGHDNFLENLGINLDYNYFPNGYSHRFDLFFRLNFMTTFRHVNSSNIGIPALHAGFGFNANLSQHFYLRFGIAPGINYYYSYFAFSANTSLSIAYRF